MRKSKNIFIIVLTLLLTLMSTAVLSLYDNAKENIAENNGPLFHYLNENLPLFTLAAARELDPDYQVFSFTDEVSEDVKEQISEYI